MTLRCHWTWEFTLEGVDDILKVLDNKLILKELVNKFRMGMCFISLSFSFSVLFLELFKHPLNWSPWPPNLPLYPLLFSCHHLTHSFQAHISRNTHLTMLIFGLRFLNTSSFLIGFSSRFQQIWPLFYLLSLTCHNELHVTLLNSSDNNNIYWEPKC